MLEGRVRKDTDPVVMVLLSTDVTVTEGVVVDRVVIIDIGAVILSQD